MSSMGLCCGCALVESRLSSAGWAELVSPATLEDEAEWWRGRPRCRMESAGGDDGDEEGGGEWAPAAAAAAWPLEMGDGCGEREERRRAGKATWSLIAER